MGRIISRRRFLGATGGAGAGFLLVPGAYATENDLPPSPDSSKVGSFLTDRQRFAARVLANEVLPRDRDPGAGDLGAVDYIEQLLTAFDSDPPRIYAAGPYSGRKPFALMPDEPDPSQLENDFVKFVPLNRYQEAAWRLQLHGSGSVPGGAPNGQKIVGLRELIPQGLDRALAISPVPIDRIPRFMMNILLQLLDRDFWKVFSELVLESTFAAPEYGGNRDLIGWRISHFEGDVHPYGYTWFDEAQGVYRERPEAPVSGPNPGKDPDPLSFTTRLLLDVVSIFTGGSVFRLKHTRDIVREASKRLENES